MDRDGDGGGDGGAPRKQTPGPPNSCGNDAAMSGNKMKFRCANQGCPNPRFHDTSTCKYQDQIVLDRKHYRGKAACAAAGFSSKSGDLSPSFCYSCLSDIDSTDSCYPSVPRHVNTTALFFFPFLFRARVCHLLCHDQLQTNAVLDSSASD